MEEGSYYEYIFSSPEIFDAFIFTVAVIGATVAIIYFLCLVSSFLIDFIRYKIGLPRKKWVAIMDSKLPPKAE